MPSFDDFQPNQDFTDVKRILILRSWNDVLWVAVLYIQKYVRYSQENTYIDIYYLDLKLEYTLEKKYAHFYIILR